MAAVACDKDRTSIRLNAKDGLIQADPDNFDAEIHSLNGLQQTHWLATCLTQATSVRPTETHNEPTIPKLKSQELSTVKMKDIPMHFFVGTKNLPKPPNFYKSEVKPLKLFCEQIIQSRLGLEDFFMFLKETLTTSKVPDFHGFNTRATRESGQSTEPKIKLIYKPLIDQTPSDPSTMMTAMIEAEKLTNEAGQAYTAFTADQQLYHVILDIIWINPQRFSNFLPRIGGMHWLMSFVGSVGVLMENRGLKR